jgi:uncharacterized protein (TIGR02147 family)
LSQVLNAKRNLSKTNLIKVADKLAFTPSETDLALKELSGASGPLADDQFRELSDDTFKFMSEWYYFAILSLAERNAAKANPKWLSERFGITRLEAQDAVARLQRLGFIQIKRGMIQYDGTQLKTTANVPSAAARNLQKNHLRLAEISLERDSLDIRDMTSMTMALKKERIPKAKAMVQVFRRKLSRFLEAEGGEDVYVLAIQLFPAKGEHK